MPSPVDKYFKEVKRDNPSYSDKQAWATAWSIVCKNGLPGSDSCSKPPSEYLTGKSASRVIARYLSRVGTEFATPEALKDYLKHHPGADSSKHTVKKKTEDEEVAEAGEKMKPLERKLADKVKGWGAGAMAFLKKAPQQVQKFVADDSFRRESMMSAHKALTEAPEKMLKAVTETVKEEVHEFKEAGQGIAAVLKGGKMTKHQKAALKTVSTHMAIGIAAAALTATGPMAGATMFAKGLARHIAAKSVSNALGHLHVLDELGHIGHGVKHLMEHLASDPRSPEAVLNRYIQAAKKGEKLDPDTVLQNFIAAAVAKEMDKLSDEDVKAAVEAMQDDDKDEGKKPKSKEAQQASRVIARYTHTL